MDQNSGAQKMVKTSTNHWMALAGLVCAAVLSRLLPHPWNWTMVGGAALLSGARFEKAWQGVLVPLLALLISDLALGFYQGMVFVYGSFALIALGAFWGREKITGWRIPVAAAVASLGFFAVTNLGVWWSGVMYPITPQGLVACYVAGLPFLGSQMLGDVVTATVLFKVWDLVQFRVFKLSNI